MCLVLDGASAFFLRKSRTFSLGTCVRKETERSGCLRASSRGTAVPAGADSCQRAPRYPGASQVATKRLLIERGGSLRRAPVPNDLVRGVAAPTGRSLHSRAVLTHEAAA